MTCRRAELARQAGVDGYLRSDETRGAPMLYWAVVFFVIAIVAAFFGFGGVASAASGIAQVLFFIFVIIFLIALVMGLVRRRPPL